MAWMGGVDGGIQTEDEDDGDDVARAGASNPPALLFPREVTLGRHCFTLHEPNPALSVS